jgi:hypothetical protein
VDGSVRARRIGGTVFLAGTLVVAAACNHGALLLPNDAATSDPTVAQDLGARDLSIRDASEPDLAHRDLAIGDYAVAPDLTSTDLAPPPPPAYDGVCTPGAMATSVYDPDCVYLEGTLSEGACYRDALVFPAAPDDYVTGFGCYAGEGMIRPTDGRFLYTDYLGGTDVGLAFTVDAVATTAYPSAPSSNDLPIATPGCGVWRLDTFRDGTLAWRCYNSGTELRIGDGSTTLTLPGTAYAFGAGRAVLAADGGGLAIVDLDGKVAVTGLPSFTSVAAARSTPNGFLAALVSGSGTPATYSLFDIAGDGTAAARGAYQLGSSSMRGGCVLEPAGAMVCFTDDPSKVFHDTITRFSTIDPPTLVYDEDLHTVKIHISYLVTGP